MRKLEVERDLQSFCRELPISGRDRQWGLYVTTAGQARTSPHADSPPAGFAWAQGCSLPEFALLYVSKGRGTLELKPGQGRALTPGTVALLRPRVWHRCAPDRETGWDAYWLCFDGELARRWAGLAFAAPSEPLLKCKDESTLLMLFTAIVPAAVRNPTDGLQQVLVGMTCHILGLLYSPQPEQPLRGLEPRLQHPIAKALLRMRSSFAAPVDLPALARESGLSYSWFRSTFVLHTGRTPHQYLLELRLARARNLLTETDLSVKEIAAATGFQDEHYFSRVFRHRMRCTPTLWRERSRASVPDPLCLEASSVRPSEAVLAQGGSPRERLV